MRAGHVEIFVSDPAAARAFYEDVLGFEVVDVQGERFVWLKSGEREFLLRPGRTAARAVSYSDAPMAIVLYTDDLAQTMTDMRAKGLSFTGTDGSSDCPTFTDPDGNWFQLVDPGSHT